MEANGLLFNSKETQCRYFDNSLWSFLDVSLPALCQTLLRENRSIRPTHDQKMKKKKSKVTMVKSAKCQVDLMTNVEIKNKETETKDLLQRTNWETDSCDRMTEQLPPSDDFYERATERLQVEKNSPTTAISGDHYPPKQHYPEVIVNVKLHGVRAANEIGAQLSEQHKEKMERINKRHMKKHKAISMHTAEETPVEEDKQTEAAQKHSPNSSIKVDSGFIDDVNVNDNINYNFCCKVDEEAKDDDGNNRSLKVQTTSEIRDITNETFKRSIDKEIKVISAESNTKEKQQDKETYTKTMPENRRLAEEANLLKMNPQEYCTTHALFEKEIKQSYNKENKERENRYQDHLTAYNIKKGQTTDTVSRNCDQNKKEMQDNQKSGTPQDNAYKTSKREEALVQKKRRNIIKEPDETRAITRYFNTDTEHQLESIKGDLDPGNSNKMKLIEKTNAVNTRRIGKEEMSDDEEIITDETMQIQAIIEPESFNCHLSDNYWKEEHDNIFNDMKTSRSQTEEEDNYENSIKNQMSKTHASAQEEENTFLINKLELKEQTGLPVIFSNKKVSKENERSTTLESHGYSTKQKDEFQVEEIQVLNDRKYIINTNENQCVKQKPTREFQTKIKERNSYESEGYSYEQENKQGYSDEVFATNETHTYSRSNNRNQKNNNSNNDAGRVLRRRDITNRMIGENNEATAHHQDTVKNLKNIELWPPKLEAENATRMESNDKRGSEKSITANISTDINFEKLTQEMHISRKTDNCSEFETKQLTDNDMNFASIQNPQCVSHFFEQENSEKEMHLTFKAKKDEIQPDYDKEGTIAIVKMNPEEQASDMISYCKTEKIYSTEVPLNLSGQNCTKNKINRLGELSCNETIGISDNWNDCLCQDVTTKEKAMFHLNSTETQENIVTEQTTKTLNSFVDDFAQLNEIDIIGPENANNEYNVQENLSQYEQKTPEDCKTLRNTTASRTTPDNSLLCSNGSFKQQPQGKLRSRNTEYIGEGASPTFSSDCKTSSPLAAISRKTSCMTDKKTNSSLPQDHIHPNSNEQQTGVNHSKGSLCIYAMPKTDARPTRRFSSAERKISHNDMIVYSVSGLKRRSRSESLTRRCALSKEWQLLTTTTTEETTILARPKSEGNKQIHENAILNKQRHETGTSFNLSLNTDSNMLQVSNTNPNNKMNVAKPTILLTPRDFFPNSCEVETDNCEDETRKCEIGLRSSNLGIWKTGESAKFHPEKPLLANMEENLVTPLTSQMELCNTNATKSNTSQRDQFVIQRENLNVNVIGTRPNCRNDTNIKVQETSKKEIKLSQNANCIKETSPKSTSKHSHSIQPYQNIFEGKELLLLKYSAVDAEANEKESQVKNICIKTTEGCQPNDSYAENTFKIKLRNSPSHEVNEKNLELRDATVQCNLTEHREAATQTNYNALKQSKRETEIQFTECNNLESLTFPILHLTYLKLQDLSNQSVDDNIGNKSITKIPKTIIDTSNFMPGNDVTTGVQGHVSSLKECSNSVKKLEGYIWYCKRTGNGTPGKTSVQKGLHRSNSLDDLCSVLPTTVISERFDTSVNQGDAIIILKLPNDK